MKIKQNYFEFRNALTKNEIQKAEEFFQKAYDEAFVIYQHKLTHNKKFDLKNEDELFALVVLVDNIIGLWKEGMIEEGVALSESLIELIDSPKLKEMLKGYSLGMESGIEVDRFFREYVNLSKVDEEFPQFLCNFNENIKELIK